MSVTSRLLPVVNNLGFIPWFPVAAGKLAQPGGTAR